MRNCNQEFLATTYCEFCVRNYLKANFSNWTSGNILYNKDSDSWYISDLGFTGLADKPLKGIFGNLPYIAPKDLAGKGYTTASYVGNFIWIPHDT